jgi:molybdopterin synthase sulfur carrier subunit
MVIKFFAYMRDYTHTKEMIAEECDTLRDLLQMLSRLYGKKFEDKVLKNGELSSEVIILINGRHIQHYDGINTKLSKNDEISIFPVVAGG